MCLCISGYYIHNVYVDFMNCIKEIFLTVITRHQDSTKTLFDHTNVQGHLVYSIKALPVIEVGIQNTFSETL